MGPGRPAHWQVRRRFGHMEKVAHCRGASFTVEATAFLVKLQLFPSKFEQELSLRTNGAAAAQFNDEQVSQ